VEKLADLIRGVEFVVHEAGDDAGFADGLIAQEHQLVFGERGHRRHFLRFSELILSKSEGGEKCSLDLNLTNKFSENLEREREREREREKQRMF
jgi:hypothetical protein